MISASAKNFLAEIFAQTLENLQTTEADYGKFFTEDYTQWTNGVVKNRAEFFAHIRTLKQSLQSLRVTIRHIVADAQSIATIHQVEVHTNTGEQAQFQVHALFTLRGSQIARTEELTHLLEGSLAHREMGSV